jgi:sugar O-acyltransferase (sialic acid O-acetyltransferase NeuD family)
VSRRHNRPRLLVYGAGVHAQVVIETIHRQGRYALVGLLDDDPAVTGRTVLGIPVLGGAERAAELWADGVTHCFVAIGDNHRRRLKVEELLGLGFELATVIDPTAIVLSRVRIAPGTLVLGHCHIGVNTALGTGCLISVSCVVGHDCVLREYAHLTPGVLLGGNVRVGEQSFLGLGCSVLPGLRIGHRVTVGAGAAVICNLPDDVVAAGVPARVIRYIKSEEAG